MTVEKHSKVLAISKDIQKPIESEAIFYEQYVYYKKSQKEIYKTKPLLHIYIFYFSLADDKS